MHYVTDYSEITCRKERDRRALADLREWTGEKAYATLILIARSGGPKAVVVGFMFRGVEGYPFAAFCRAYCLEAYRAWLTELPDPVLTDDEGFALETVGAVQ